MTLGQPDPRPQQARPNRRKSLSAILLYLSRLAMVYSVQLALKKTPASRGAVIENPGWIPDTVFK